MLTYSRKRIFPQLRNNVPVGALSSYSENGSIAEEMFL
jgi:hypothetical protein